MSKKVWFAGVSLAIGMGYVAGALAQAKPEVLVKQRQAAMTLQGKYYGPLAAMAQGKAPYNKDTVERNAEYLSVLDKMPWDGFAESTKDEKSVKTAALPAIWKDGDKFKQAQKNFQDEVSKLVQVSKGGDEAAVKAQIGAVGKACGACHGDFREKQQ
ncbi:MAG TPA: cytochrome c [Myxococcales bacterium]|nr:cytochrome c [Myxococcales bacterium]